MEKQTNLQQLFFQKIKENLPSNVSFVDEIASLLNISYNSVYRRISGKKQLTFSEIYSLSTFYKIPVDSIFKSKQPDNISFQIRAIEPNNQSFENWLNAIANDMKMLAGAKEKQIIYAAKDPPIWHHWNFPDIASFKIFFWKKTLLQIPDYADKKFAFDEYNDRLHEVGRNILRYSTKIPTIELWNEDTFNILLKQIEYYWTSGVFCCIDDVLRLCNSLEKWVRHIEKQAELGFKFIYGEEPTGLENTYELYENEIVLNDNTILFQLLNNRICYLTYNTLNILATTEPEFIDSIDDYFNLLKKKSMLISSYAYKERNRFFNKLISNIDQFKRKLKPV